jgi:dUTP pyrophosphatase
MEETRKVLLRLSDGAVAPSYGSDGAAGADIRAHIQEEITLYPGKRVLVPTGLYFEIPQGLEIQVRPRSGLAFKNGITVLNTPGTIDSDYRGELKVLLINHGEEEFVIEPGMRIAQIVVAVAIRGEFETVEELSLSSRGEKGFGHTGLK